MQCNYAHNVYTSMKAVCPVLEEEETDLVRLHTSDKKDSEAPASTFVSQLC